MEIGGLLNTRHGGATDVGLGQQHLHHPMQMNGGGYGMSQPSNQTMNHHPQHMHDPNMSYQNLHHQSSNEHVYASNYDARSQNDANTMDDEFSAIRQKGEAAAKAFACSTCQKGFARRSDLARHGTISSRTVHKSC